MCRPAFPCLENLGKKCNSCTYPPDVSGIEQHIHTRYLVPTHIGIFRIRSETLHLRLYQEFFCFFQLPCFWIMIWVKFRNKWFHLSEESNVKNIYITKEWDVSFTSYKQRIARFCMVWLHLIKKNLWLLCQDMVLPVKNKHHTDEKNKGELSSQNFNNLNSNCI